MKIKQYQTSINIDKSKLSKGQVYIREQCQEQPTIKKTCSSCGKTKPLTEFRKRTKRHGKIGVFYDAKCKDCHARVRGTKEIGKYKFSVHLFQKGFRRCNKCLDIKLLSDFYINKAQYTSINYTCKLCVNKFNLKKYHESKSNKINNH